MKQVNESDLNCFMEQVDTTELIQACRKGDHAAQCKIYRMYSHTMYQTAYRILRHKQEAEDAMQEGFLKAFTKLDSFQADAPFGAWLRKIITNEALDIWRKKKRQPQLSIEETAFPEESHSTSSLVEGQIIIEKIKLAMNQMKENYRVALCLHLIDGYDYHEISDYMSISYGNCRTLISRAKAQLRDLIETL